MLTIGIRVIVATAAALLAQPVTHAQARDCDRYPALCEPSAEAKAAAETPPRVTAPVQKRKARAAKRHEKPTTASVPSRTASREQPARMTSRGQSAASASRGTTTLDSAVLLQHSLSEARSAMDIDQQIHSPALAAAGAWIALPTDDPRTGAGLEVAPAQQEHVTVPSNAVRFVNPHQVNEIDLAASDAAASSWLRYLLATFGAAVAAASTLRFFAV
jgi:hypothetical protein